MEQSWEPSELPGTERRSEYLPLICLWLLVVLLRYLLVLRVAFEFGDTFRLCVAGVCSVCRTQSPQGGGGGGAGERQGVMVEQVLREGGTESISYCLRSFTHERVFCCLL